MAEKDASITGTEQVKSNEQSTSGSSKAVKARPRASKKGRKRSKKASVKRKAQNSDSEAEFKKKTERPFPRVTLEDAIRVANAIKAKNAGNPYASEDVAAALDIGAKGARFFYLSSGARNYGLTVGTRDSERISLTELGRSVVYPSSPVEAIEAKRKAFLNIDIFRRVLEHYKGTDLPEMEFLSNTLTRDFGLSSEFHAEFVSLFQKNCQYLGITSWPPAGSTAYANQRGGVATTSDPAVVTIAQSKQETGLLCFVIQPFTEREDGRSEGFFEEVLRSLIVPAATEAGFTVRSARRQGSDVIQQTIVSDLLEADLVVADLTEHNPNVMFELGMRMAQDKPVALIRARGTSGIFDVDNMLRVFDYDPNLWPSTLEQDLPTLKEHFVATWDNRESENTYMKLLGRPVTKTS